MPPWVDGSTNKHEKNFSISKLCRFRMGEPFMKRPLFRWTKNVIKAYGRLYIPQEHLEGCVSLILARIRNYPFKIYCASQISYFLLEFILPLFFGYWSRFSKLTPSSANSLLESMQNTRNLALRIILSLCKMPVLTSLNCRPEAKTISWK